ncbi:MAG: recombination protein RecA [Candidatus Omnitrophota bacterium]|jgi:recombination protein RecA
MKTLEKPLKKEDKMAAKSKDTKGKVAEASKNAPTAQAAKSAKPSTATVTSGKQLPARDAGALNDVIAQITKQFGDGAIMKLGSEEGSSPADGVISTGALTLDLALGVGGIPRGRVVEIYGPESSGKTTLMLHIVANVQRAGGQAAFIDTEHALDPVYARKIGVNLDELLVSQPDSGEEAMNICETLVKSNAIDIVVVDSVAALAPKAELEGEMGQSHVGLQARLMSQALRKLTGSINRSKTTVLFTNQIREKIGVMFGSPETTPGGRALKFYSSIRMDIRRIATLKDNKGEAFGNRAKVKVVKNKVAPPFREAEFDILYAEGISWTGSIVDCAIAHGLIEKRGSWLSFDGQQLGQGRDSAKEALKTDPALAQILIDRVMAKVHGVELPKE